MAIFFPLAWKYLPRENWQILAALPSRRDSDGWWLGVNLTFYGLLISLAVFVSSSVFLILMGSLGLTLLPTLLTILTVLSFALISSKLLALFVERKRHTLTVGGALFATLLVLPLIIEVLNLCVRLWTNEHIPLLPVLAAGMISYCLGEGLGRLACVSFGCCYGKPLNAVHPILGRLFEIFHFRFEGRTKKISYESNLEGVQVIPIQALSSIVLCSTGLTGIYLFFEQMPTFALLTTVTISQLWRVFSEFLRADFRGTGKWSLYQYMALGTIPFTLFLLGFSSGNEIPAIRLESGLALFWDPSVLLSLQAISLLIFFSAGRSTVTHSNLFFIIADDELTQQSALEDS
jgi:hypothetical protein